MDKKYTAKELDLLHAELYDILGETIRICRKHDIPYFVIGGTAIGALYDWTGSYGSAIGMCAGVSGACLGLLGVIAVKTRKELTER